MITIKRLKELIKDIPDDAKLYAYDGENTGIVIRKDNNEWYIEASEIDYKDLSDDTYTEGFAKNESK